MLPSRHLHSWETKSVPSSDTTKCKSKTTTSFFTRLRNWNMGLERRRKEARSNRIEAARASLTLKTLITSRNSSSSSRRTRGLTSRLTLGRLFRKSRSPLASVKTYLRKYKSRFYRLKFFPNRHQSHNRVLPANFIRLMRSTRAVWSRPQKKNYRLPPRSLEVLSRTWA